MKIKCIYIIALLSCIYAKVSAQEIAAKVTVNATRVGNTVNKNVFTTLQNALNTFINNRKWTGDNFAANEKIECNFLLNLQAGAEANVYTASLTIQAARPIFQSTYLSPIVNYQDEDITFKYIEYQQLEFNENRVGGSDALVSNLPAVFAYYVYMVLGFDYNSFEQRGGNIYFQKAQNIVNNAPDGRGISGWKAFDGIRNRYWLAENMLNSRYAIINDVYYNYYRSAFDKMYQDENAARAEMMNVLNLMDNFNTENPNTMINQFFFQGKANELIKIFSKSPQQDKLRAAEILQKLDITNANRNKNELK